MQLQPYENDILKEVATIGAGNASNALSQMANHQVSVQVPNLYLEKVEKISSLVGNTEEVATVVVLKVVGKTPGNIFLIFPPEDAVRLVELLTNKPYESTQLDELAISALKEVGNILSGAAINAISSFLNISLLQTIPDVVTDMVQAIVESLVAEYGMNNEKVLMMEIVLSIAEKNLNGRLYFLFDPESTNQIIEKSKNKLNG